MLQCFVQKMLDKRSENLIYEKKSASKPQSLEVLFLRILKGETKLDFIFCN